MPVTEELHECDLFLLSSHHSYYANKALENFARLGSSNIDGWGLGYYLNGGANVLRSAEPVFEGKTLSGSLSREFTMTIRAVSSPIVLGHLRLSSRGSRIPENNHPFKLRFLDYEWLLIHNGTSPRFQELVSADERLLNESDNDTARIFEFLRQNIINYYLATHKKSLIEACRNAYATLLQRDPGGKFNLILTNGFLSFVFIHWRPFYMLLREKESGDAVIISTLKLTDEDFITIKATAQRKAKLLVFSGPTLVFNGDVPK